jgi:uncharacterized protein YqgC (DUF456 family)
MTDLSWLYWLLVALMLVGVVGAIVPAIPGMGLVMAAIVVWGIVKGFSTVAVALGVAVVFFLISLGIDFLAAYWGAKQAGASKWGQIGAFVGLLVGLFGLLPALPVGGPLFGIILGPLLGAIVGEFLYRRDLMIAFKAGVGIVVGSVVGQIIHVLLALATTIVFLWTTFPYKA